MLRSRSNHLLVKKSVVETLSNSKSQQALPKKPMIAKGQTQGKKPVPSKAAAYEPKPVSNILNQRSSKPMQFKK